MEKETKKGFWASIFAPKSSSCCGSQIEEIKEIKEDKEEIKSEKADKENDEKIHCAIVGVNVTKNN